MNRAARTLTARDPLISANAVRFLMMAGTSASTFLAGFRPRQNGEKLYMRQTAPSTLVARQAAVHNGDGSFSSNADRGRITLSYGTHRYSYDEETMYLGPDGYSTGTELSIMDQRLPDTVITALSGRPLRDVIGYSSTPAFFASKFTTIVDAQMSDFPFSLSQDLELILAIKWHPLSRVLSHLR
ncbi:MAG: hypothetical protein ABI240_08830 [Sphingomonas sp.]